LSGASLYMHRETTCLIACRLWLLGLLLAADEPVNTVSSSGQWVSFGTCKDCAADRECPTGLKCSTSKACVETSGYYPTRKCGSNSNCRSGACQGGSCVQCTKDSHCADSPVYKSLWQCRKAANPMDNSCQPVKRCFSDEACGLAASEDSRYVPGRCVGKTCLTCGRHGDNFYWEAGPFDFLSKGPKTYCNMQSYSWN